MSAYCPYLHPPIYFDNHRSALDHPHIIDAYIASEQSAGRYSNGFTPSELEALIGPFCTAPLGVIPKPNSTKFRIIQDLSFPRGNPTTPSINAGINPDCFPTSWGSFSETATLILSLPEGCLAATFDIEAAYRIVPLAISQQASVCIHWKGLIYVDRALMFGLSSSAGVFGLVADMVVAIYQKAGFGPIKKWVDNFFVVSLPDQSWTEQDFVRLTVHIAVPWSPQKICPLASCQCYIGFDWDLAAKSVALLDDKLSKLLTTLLLWLSPESRHTQKEAQSLHGRLVHASCIFRLIKPFLCSLIFFAKSFRSLHARRFLPRNVLADLHQTDNIIRISPSRVPLRKPDPVDINWWGDASTSFGIGVVIDSYWAVWHWCPGFAVGPGREFDIGWAEAIAVELGLITALHLCRFLLAEYCAASS